MWLRAAAMGVALMASSVPAVAQTTIRWFISESTAETTVWQRDVARRYQEANPNVRFNIEVMSGEPYKQKLATALQSNDRPHLIYTWGGGVMFAQAEAGLLQDISAQMRGAWADSLNPGAVEALSRGGRVFGAPTHQTMVALFYNRRLLAQAGVDPESLRTWDGLLEGVRKLRAAGIQPFSAGGSDKWPLNMIWANLSLRVGGRASFEAAFNRQGQGFAGPDFLRASDLFKQLIDLQPFQRGFLGDTAPQAAGQFGDGRVALQVMGNWFVNTQRTQSANQQGIPDADFGWLPFPEVSGGRAAANDVVGGVNGFLVTRGAPPEAVDFLRFYTSPAIQREAAERGFFIPASRGAGEALQNRMLREIALYLSRAGYVQNFYDQMLGPSVGRVANDTSADLATGRITPRQVGRLIQDAWELEQ
jgi:raffinose/stachyose/melibiose transport system substrate-binding protein